MQAVVQEMQVKPPFSFDQMGAKAIMKTCALCHGKLGLVPASIIYGMGVGGLMFACSVRCESICEAARKLWNHSRTIMGGSRLVRRRNVPRQIEQLTLSSGVASDIRV